MKKFAITLAVFVAGLATNAAFADYQTMEFRSVDGGVTNVALDNLKMSFSDGNLIVTNGAQQFSFPVSSLSSMEFSTAMAGTVGIADQTVSDSSITVYSIDGICYGEFGCPRCAEKALPSGTYILISKDGKTKKIAFSK